LIAPALTLARWHPRCVHVALQALNTPPCGWVTTAFLSRRTVPPPIGAPLVFTEPAVSGVLQAEVVWSSAARLAGVEEDGSLKSHPTSVALLPARRR
jgi:hypothetical protein